MKRIFLLKGLDCPNCSAKIEKEVGELDGVQSSVVNLMKQTLIINVAPAAADTIDSQIETIVHSHEPSIARAFLKDAPILILDEMTSNVDPVNESLIQDAITELAKNRTVLVVAHHLKTIQKADQILVFQKGNLLEKGKHGELLDKNGYYTKLWKAQYEV